MSAGPLRRITAVVGLLAMAPIVLLVLTSALAPQEAAVRALLVASVVVLVGNLARIALTQLLHQVERALPTDGDPGEREGPAATGAQQPLQRRAEDRLQPAPGR